MITNTALHFNAEANQQISIKYWRLITGTFSSAFIKWLLLLVRHRTVYIFTHKTTFVHIDMGSSSWNNKNCFKLHVCDNPGFHFHSHVAVPVPKLHCVHANSKRIFMGKWESRIHFPRCRPIPHNTVQSWSLYTKIQKPEPAQTTPRIPRLWDPQDRLTLVTPLSIVNGRSCPSAVPHIWNSLPDDVVSIESLSSLLLAT